MFVSVRDSVVMHAGYEKLIDGLRDIDVWAVELNIDRQLRVASLTEPGKLVSIVADEEVEAYKEELERNGVRVSALLLSNNFGVEDIEAELNWIVEAIRRAHKLGCIAVRIDSAMSGEREMPFEERVKRFCYCLKRVIGETEDTNIPLGIENHGYQGNTPEFLQAVIEGVGSERLGLTLDTGNFYWYGHPLSTVYEIERMFAPLTKHTHLKNIRYPEEMREIQREVGWRYGEFVCPLPDGDINHAIIVRYLRDANYDGDLCIEDESLGKFDLQERKAVLKRDADYVKSLLSK
ncbi:MAG: sugar phosphate isomerase/epimerase family protein [Armatimonadota bacterium]|nr:sugar phosphate isomerase/epimerase [Armatimonadota bacterium]MCX7777453.1 sugar phosphate isomerase/epimerase [Armatimonadota bacterium]MDW8025539.1 sugar phosphate isomerase/epimerase family protein [Armatimonadota bacterium]